MPLHPGQARSKPLQNIQTKMNSANAPLIREAAGPIAPLVVVVAVTNDPSTGAVADALKSALLVLYDCCIVVARAGGIDNPLAVESPDTAWAVVMVSPKPDTSGSATIFWSTVANAAAVVAAVLLLVVSLVLREAGTEVIAASSVSVRMTVMLARRRAITANERREAAFSNTPTEALYGLTQSLIASPSIAGSS